MIPPSDIHLQNVIWTHERQIYRAFFRGSRCLMKRLTLSGYVYPPALENLPLHRARDGQGAGSNRLFSRGKPGRGPANRLWATIVFQSCRYLGFSIPSEVLWTFIDVQLQGSTVEPLCTYYTSSLLHSRNLSHSSTYGIRTYEYASEKWGL